VFIDKCPFTLFNTNVKTFRVENNIFRNLELQNKDVSYHRNPGAESDRKGCFFFFFKICFQLNNKRTLISSSKIAQLETLYIYILVFIDKCPFRLFNTNVKTSKLR
jgi:hypothetical protein